MKRGIKPLFSPFLSLFQLLFQWRPLSLIYLNLLLFCPPQCLPVLGAQRREHRNKMGYFSCKTESAAATCDSFNFKKQVRKKKKKKTEARANGKENSSGYRLFTYEELESATNGFSSKSLLGKGSHGSVYKAVLDNGKLIAAVKKPTASSSSSEENNKSNCNSSNNSISNNNNSPGENEIEILSRIRNAGFVNLLGFSLDSNERKLIVVEFMPNGTLYDQLHCSPRVPSWGKRIRFALQTAKAVEALHSSNPPVIHRDIKSSNILVDEKWKARLGDFGLALRGHVEDVRMRSTPPAGTLGYLDPGYITPGNLSAKSDVFSFGILLLEIISGRNAIDMNYSPPSVVDWALPPIRRGEFDGLYDPRIGPPKDPFVRQQLAVLAARCVRSTAEKRPSMGEVVDCLRIANKRVCLPIWNNLTNQMKKLAPVDRETDTNSIFYESMEEIATGSRQTSRNSSRRRKVSNVQYGVDFTKKRTDYAVDCSGCTDLTELLSEKNVGSCSRIGNPHGANETTLAVRMAGIKLRRSRSNGISRTGSRRGASFVPLKHPPNDTSDLDVPEVALKSEKELAVEDS